MSRNVWFKKLAWSYVPCSVEGFGVVFSGVVVVLLGLWSLSYLERTSGANLDLVKVGLFVVVLLGTLLIAKRHSG